MTKPQDHEEYAAPEARYITGHVMHVLRSMPDASVDLVLTSPPFLGLRSYLPADDPNKALEIGGEPTPGEFIDALLDVVEECRRVLAPHGSIAFELGDTYAGSGGAGGDYNAEGLRAGQEKFSGSAAKRRKLGQVDNDRPARNHRRQRDQDEALGILAPRRRPGPEGRDQMDGWPLDKSLCLVPEMFRFALVYGFNPLTGRQTPRWRARNVVRWCRPNPPVGALGDKFRPGTSDMVIVCADRKRYFDLDAVRQPSEYDRPNLRGQGSRGPGEMVPGQRRNGSDHTVNPGGAPPLDWWEVSTEGYPGSHYATWPQKLIEKPIEAMCPRRVCTVCGMPSERITESERTMIGGFGKSGDMKVGGTGKAGAFADSATVTRTTTGWTDCGHDAWRAGVVLDPFAGSGTTLAVAFGHGRSSIGIDLDRRNAELARQRVGMWLITQDAEPMEASA